MQITLTPALAEKKSTAIKNNSNIPLYSRHADLSINFSGDKIDFSKIEVNQARFDEELKNLSGVHCPSCGFEMIPEAKYKTMLKKAKSITKGKEFVELISPYKRALKSDYKEFYSFASKYVENNPDCSIYDFIGASKSNARRNLYKNLNYVCANLKNESEKKEYSSEDRELLNEAALRLDSFKRMKNSDKLTRNVIRNELNATIGIMESPEKVRLTKFAINRIDGKARQYNIFISDEAFKKITASEILEHMLSRSVSNVTRISKMGGAEIDKPYNTLLVCDDCDKARGNFSGVTVWEKIHPKFMDNFTSYRNDMAHKTIIGEITEDKRYVLGLTGHVRKLTKTNMLKPDDKMLEQVRIKCLGEPDRTFEALKNKGESDTNPRALKLSPNKKEQILREIEDASDFQELGLIVKDIQKFVHPLYRGLTDEFLKYVRENPECSDFDVLQDLRGFSHNIFADKIKFSVKLAQRALKNPEFNFVDKGIINDYIDGIDKFLDTPSEKPFRYEKYMNHLRSTIKVMQNKDAKRFYTYIRDNMKAAQYIEELVFPTDKKHVTTKKIMSDIIKSN